MSLHHPFFTLLLQDGGAFLGSNLPLLSLTSTTVNHNTAGRDGGGLSCQQCQELKLQSSAFANNSAGGMGGGLHCGGCARVHLTDGCRFEVCQAQSGAGVTVVGIAAGEGGAVPHPSRTGAAVVIHDCRVYNNTARYVYESSSEALAASHGISGEADDRGHGGSASQDGRRKLFAAGTSDTATTAAAADSLHALVVPDLTHWVGSTATLHNIPSSSSSSSGTSAGGASGFNSITSSSSSSGVSDAGSSSGTGSGGPRCGTSGAGGGLCIQLEGPMNMARVEVADNRARLGGELIPFVFLAPKAAFDSLRCATYGSCVWHCEVSGWFNGYKLRNVLFVGQQRALAVLVHYSGCNHSLLSRLDTKHQL